MDSQNFVSPLELFYYFCAKSTFSIEDERNKKGINCP